MYNLRYHLASLVGVFLALALGLILGGLVVQRGTVDRQQESLVDSLKQEFKSLRAENSDLSDENGLLTSFSEDLGDAWIADRLVGRSVVVLANSGKGAGLNATLDALEQAGASPVLVTIQKPALGMKDAAIRSKITSSTEFTDELLQSVAASLTAEWTMPNTKRPLTQALIDAEVFTIDSFAPGMVAYGVIDIAAIDGKPEQGALVILERFDRNDSPAVAAESRALKTGIAAAGAQRGLSAFDTLDTAVGRYTLVSLLNGAKPGYYGQGEGVDAPYPAPTTR